jgi:hypothetical protein
MFFLTTFNDSPKRNEYDTQQWGNTYQTATYNIYGITSSQVVSYLRLSFVYYEHDTISMNVDITRKQNLKISFIIYFTNNFITFNM